MIDIYTIIAILFAHWVADFICQTQYMALNKAKSLKALGLHALAYTIAMLFLLAPILTSGNGTMIGVFTSWILINGFLHGAVDFVSSKATSYQYNRGRMSNFYNIIGFDQFVHAVILFSTYLWLFE